MTGGEPPGPPVRLREWSWRGPAVENDERTNSGSALPAPFNPKVAVHF